MTTATKETTKRTSKRKIRTPKVVSAKAEAPKKSKRVNPHAEHNSLSEFLTTSLDAKVKVVDNATMTPRYQRALYAIRKTYGQKAFPAGGIDGGILRSLSAAGMISLTGGQQDDINGIPYLIDGEKPLVAKVTAAGSKYGTV